MIKNKPNQLFMFKKPIIGITLDLENKKVYSNFPWYACRKNYADPVSIFGGIPIFLPHDSKNISNYMNILSGIIITGGDFDVDPRLYGEEIKSSKIVLKKNRTLFELKILEKSIKKKIPILAICGGQQLLNVVLGGTLFQDINDEIETKIDHEQKNPRNQPSHFIEILNDTKLKKIVKSKKMFVNSAHHQSVKNLGKNLIINAKSNDGIIEGIEHTKLEFCVGIQWHPEFLIDEGDKKIFQAFIGSAINSDEKKF